MDPLVLILIGAVGIVLSLNLIINAWPTIKASLPQPRLPSLPVVNSAPGEASTPAKPIGITMGHVAMAVIIVLLVAMLLRQQQQPAPGPGPEPHPDLSKLDLYPAFSRSPDHAKAASDAAIFADLCGSLADTLDFDGREAEPRVLKGTQADDLRMRARHYQFRGRALTADYPLLPEAVKAYMDSVIGAEVGGELDSPTRQKFVSAFREIERAAASAAAKLL